METGGRTNRRRWKNIGRKRRGREGEHERRQMKGQGNRGGEGEEREMG